jgi:hypothetical protein
MRVAMQLGQGGDGGVLFIPETSSETTCLRNLIDGVEPVAIVRKTGESWEFLIAPVKEMR